MSNDNNPDKYVSTNWRNEINTRQYGGTPDNVAQLFVSKMMDKQIADAELPRAFDAEVKASQAIYNVFGQYSDNLLIAIRGARSKNKSHPPYQEGNPQALERLDAIAELIVKNFSFQFNRANLGLPAEQEVTPPTVLIPKGAPDIKTGPEVPRADEKHR